jgi:hypothetical protein
MRRCRQRGPRAVGDDEPRRAKISARVPRHAADHPHPAFDPAHVQRRLVENAQPHRHMGQRGEPRPQPGRTLARDIAGRDDGDEFASSLIDTERGRDQQAGADRRLERGDRLNEFDVGGARAGHEGYRHRFVAEHEQLIRDRLGPGQPHDDAEARAVLDRDPGEPTGKAGGDRVGRRHARLLEPELALGLRRRECEPRRNRASVA